MFGCPGGTTETDTGTQDTPAVIDAPSTVDAPAAEDAPTAEDAPVANDAPAAVDAPVAVDAPGPVDGGGAATCAPGPCPETCFVMNRCVATCGGPEISCGCCECGEGSVNVLTCPTPAR